MTSSSGSCYLHREFEATSERIPSMKAYRRGMKNYLGKLFWEIQEASPIRGLRLDQWSGRNLEAGEWEEDSTLGKNSKHQGTEEQRLSHRPG